MVGIDVLFYFVLFFHVHIRFLEMTQCANITLEPFLEQQFITAQTKHV